jgi:hypothetical protein
MDFGAPPDRLTKVRLHGNKNHFLPGVVAT